MGLVEKMDRDDAKLVDKLRQKAKAHPHLNQSSPIAEGYGARRRLASRTATISPGSYRLGFSDAISAGDAVRFSIVKREEFLAQQGPVKQLVKRGRWNVPPASRPKGWEKMGIAEMSADDAAL